MVCWVYAKFNQFLQPLPEKVMKEMFVLVKNFIPFLGLFSVFWGPFWPKNLAVDSGWHGEPF